MPLHGASRTFPYTCEQLFDLAADIESYPKYLPGWIDARILERSGNQLRVEQQLGLKFLSLHFVTTAVLDRPQQILIRSSDKPFHFLQIQWHFESAARGFCTLSLEIGYRLRMGFLERAVQTLFEHSSQDILDEFNKRAQQLYSTY